MKFKMVFADFAILLFIELPVFGQQKVDKFCSVTISSHGYRGDKLSAHINIGEVDSLFRFKDSSVVKSLRKVNSLTSSIDVMNYMSKLGWTMVTLAPHLTYNYEVESIYFKKSYDASELY